MRTRAELEVREVSAPLVSSRSAWFAAVFLFVFILFPQAAEAADDPANSDCLACHSDKTMTTKRAGRTVSLFVDEKKFNNSVHGPLSCINCHADLAGKELPHSTPVAKVNCGTCHSGEAEQHARSLHGKALARGDPLAPRCVNCHGNHDIVPVKDPGSAVAPLKVPFLCGQCHQEGTPVQMNRDIGQHNILENFSESIHGQGLLKKGL
ncbi:MAG TPA: cytochrome c3 family protein, partial [Candidatus Acidoferrales bacterium]|nr:cytochrome c3 family protein [Candidatus Acidoferrales bacterium]